MPQQNNETRINLAIQALQRQPKSSVRTIAKIYEVDHRRLGERLRSIPPRRAISANSRKMTDLEESVLVEHILDLAAKGFPPRLCVVEDMANRLVATRQGEPVGPHWAGNFVRRRPELQTRFQCKYDY